jgi:hypothetical protein
MHLKRNRAIDRKVSIVFSEPNMVSISILQSFDGLTCSALAFEHDQGPRDAGYAFGRH